MLPRLKIILKAIEPHPSCPQSRQQVTPCVSKQEHVFLVRDLSKTSAAALWGFHWLSKGSSYLLAALLTGFISQSWFVYGGHTIENIGIPSVICTHQFVLPLAILHFIYYLA